MISVLILTLNEELNLPACLESVRWSDDIVVLDDGSTDRTIEIAESFGARVIRHSAGGERAQREYSIRSIPFRYSWVYNPDADEVTLDLQRDEMLRVVSDSSREEVAYRVRFRNMFMGGWLKHSSLYPTWVVRLFKPDKISFERDINLTYVIDGKCGFLANDFYHYSFNNGLSAWFEKHNRYSELEAKEAVKMLGDGIVDWKGLIVINDPARHRKALKNFAWLLPCRPMFVFIYLYVVRMGFLDGLAGLRYCRMRAIYEYMIDLKIMELRRREKGLPV
ncbi:MAG: glycosyltransferase family 2 protein [bacterium]